jgi:general secretion pathway protein G
MISGIHGGPPRVWSLRPGIPFMRQRGYSLIELIITIAILAVLSSLAVVAYDGYVAEARIDTAMQDIREAELTLGDLARDNALGSVDADAAGTLNVYQAGNGLVLATSAPANAEPWLDPWDNAYRYRRPAARTDAAGMLSNATTAGQSFDLFSTGPDGVQSADDIIRGCNGGYVGTAAGHRC